MNFTRYHIKKGRHDWRPLDGFAPYFWQRIKCRKIIVYAFFDPNCLFDHKGDVDLKWDWNKLPGISLRPLWRPKNKDAVMIGWRPSEIKDHFDITPYANLNGGRVVGWQDDKNKDEVFLRVKPNEIFRYFIYARSRKEWICRVEKQDSKGKWWGQQTLIRFDHKPSLLSKVGTWFGGADNNNNGLGGVAPQEMDLYIDWSIKKQ